MKLIIIYLLNCKKSCSQQILIHKKKHFKYVRVLSICVDVCIEVYRDRCFV